MVLDALRIGVGGLRIDAERDEQIPDDQMTLARDRRHLAPLVGQEDRAIGLAGHEAVTLQPLDRVVDGRLGDAEPWRSTSRASPFSSMRSAMSST